MEQQSSPRGVPGPAPLSRQRKEYERLIARGVSNAEACRMVGMNRRTGIRWRYGRAVRARDGTVREYPAVIDPKERPARSARYLSEEDRAEIADLRRAKVGMRSIAHKLGAGMAARGVSVNLIKRYGCECAAMRRTLASPAARGPWRVAGPCSIWLRAAVIGSHRGRTGRRIR